MSEKDGNICGKYRHYKGNLYDAYCLAQDTSGEEYVLYQKLYGDMSFWIRPKAMFFETVELTGKTVERFALIHPHDDPLEKIDQLIKLTKEADCQLLITHSETEQLFVIAEISCENQKVVVAPAVPF